jgi:YggT family protein
MFLAENFLIAVATVLDWVLWAYVIVLIARAVMSWVNADRYNPIVQFLHAVTEPVLRRVRRRLPMYQIGVDLSPMVVILAIWFLQLFLVRSLFNLAHSLR